MPLSEAESAFLADRNLTFLFARRPDGSPAGWPMTSVLAGDGLMFSSYAKSAKVMICLAAGQATALVVRREGDEIVRAVCVSGPVRLTPPGQQAGPGAIDVPGAVRDRVRSATAGGKRVELAARGHQCLLRQAGGTGPLTALPWSAKRMSSIIQ